jgi:serine/threonine protein phosphatase PrpC
MPYLAAQQAHNCSASVVTCVAERTKEPVGPFRVYLQYSWSPGLACSRAFGDKMAVEVGVTHKPDVTMHSLQPEDQYLIVASDGVWELVSSQVGAHIFSDSSKQLFGNLHDRAPTYSLNSMVFL